MESGMMGRLVLFLMLLAFTAPCANAQTNHSKNADAARDFGRAESLKVAGKEDEAFLAFSDFLRRYSSDSLLNDMSLEAQFGMAEIYFHQRRFSEALNEYKKVFSYVQKKHSRIADSALRMGECFQRLEKPELAEIEWEAVRREFPNTEAAHQAIAKLMSLATRQVKERQDRK